MQTPAGSWPIAYCSSQTGSRNMGRMRVLPSTSVRLQHVLVILVGMSLDSACSLHAPPRQEVTQEERDAVATFLREVGPSFDAAEDACFQASQCGAVDRRRSHGAVGSASEIRSCIEYRRPNCEKARAELDRYAAPATVQSLWRGAVDFGVTRAAEHAGVTAALLASLDGAYPEMSIPSKGYIDVEDWVVARHPAIDERYGSLRDRAVQWQAAALALDDWTRANALCPPGDNCTFRKVMHLR